MAQLLLRATGDDDDDGDSLLPAVAYMTIRTGCGRGGGSTLNSILSLGLHSDSATLQPINGLSSSSTSSSSSFLCLQQIEIYSDILQTTMNMSQLNEELQCMGILHHINSMSQFTLRA